MSEVRKPELKKPNSIIEREKEVKYEQEMLEKETEMINRYNKEMQMLDPDFRCIRPMDGHILVRLMKPIKANAISTAIINVPMVRDPKTQEVVPANGVEIWDNVGILVSAPQGFPYEAGVYLQLDKTVVTPKLVPHSTSVEMPYKFVHPKLLKWATDDPNTLKPLGYQVVPIHSVRVMIPKDSIQFECFKFDDKKVEATLNE